MRIPAGAFSLWITHILNSLGLMQLLLHCGRFFLRFACPTATPVNAVIIFHGSFHHLWIAGRLAVISFILYFTCHAYQLTSALHLWWSHSNDTGRSKNPSQSTRFPLKWIDNFLCAGDEPKSPYSDLFVSFICRIHSACHRSCSVDLRSTVRVPSAGQ